MRTIYYVNSYQLSKSSRDDHDPYTMIEITDELSFGKVKVNTYCFDILCAYVPVNYIGNDIVENNIIKELNWDNVLNDLKDGSIHRKYWYKWFLYRMYDFDAIYKDFGSDLLVIYKDNEIIGSINTSKLKYHEKTLQELEMELNYMIDHNIDKDKAEKLLDIVKNDPEVRMSNEEHFRLKYGEQLS